MRTAKKSQNERPALVNKDIIKGHIIPYQKDSLWGLYDDAEKKIILEPQYNAILLGKMSHVFAAKHKGKWGAINSLGEVIVGFYFESVEVRSTYIVTHNKLGEYFLYAPTGKMLAKDVYIIQEILEHEKDEQPHLAVFAQEGKQGLLNLQTGSFVIQPNFTEIQAKEPLNGRLWIAVQKDEKGKWYLFSLEGEQLDTIGFLSVEVGKMPCGVVSCAKHKMGIVDEKGELSVPCQYYKISLPTDTITSFQTQNNKWGKLHIKTGKLVSKPK